MQKYVDKAAKAYELYHKGLKHECLDILKEALKRATAEQDKEIIKLLSGDVVRIEAELYENGKDIYYYNQRELKKEEINNIFAWLTVLKDPTFLPFFSVQFLKKIFKKRKSLIRQAINEGMIKEQRLKDYVVHMNKIIRKRENGEYDESFYKETQEQIEKEEENCDYLTITKGDNYLHRDEIRKMWEDQINKPISSVSNARKTEQD